MGKRYFLTDAELKNANDDFFNCNDLKKNIFKILENNEPPYNIAVIGKWGLGKSSLVNLVKRELENKQTNPGNSYRVIQINAWKYEKETLAKVFLRQVLHELGNSRKTTVEVFAETMGRVLSDTGEAKTLRKGKYQKDERNTIGKAILHLVRQYGVFIAVLCVATAILYAAYKRMTLLLLGQSMDHFLLQVFTGYCRNVGAILLLPLFLSFAATVLDRFKEKETKIGINYPMPGIEDYEIMLDQEMLHGHHENEKVVIILDDLDRLSTKKMMEALDAIKVFINYNNFIFIVPFDDEILKKSMVLCQDLAQNKMRSSAN